MSRENVELVMRLFIPADVDYVPLYRDDEKWAALSLAAASFFQPDIECTFITSLVGTKTYAGLDGMRTGWLDVLAPVGDVPSGDRARHRPRSTCRRSHAQSRTP